MCVCHLCEWLLCLCNPWSGLGYSVNNQQHNAALLRPAMVWVSATITSAVGGRVKDWKMFHKSNNEKYWQCKFSQIKADKHADRQEGRGAEQRGKLTDPEDIWRDLLINVKEFSVYDTKYISDYYVENWMKWQERSRMRSPIHSPGWIINTKDEQLCSKLCSNLMNKRKKAKCRRLQSMGTWRNHFLCRQGKLNIIEQNQGSNKDWIENQDLTAHWSDEGMKCRWGDEQILSSGEGNDVIRQGAGRY